MQKRSEQDMAAMTSVSVKWGKRDIEIPVAPRKLSLAWRKRFREIITSVGHNTTIPAPEDGEVQSWSVEQFLPAVLMTFAQSPEIIEELVLMYAPELPADDPNATDEQVMLAFNAIFQLANPGFMVLGMMMDLGKMTPSNSAAPKYTN